MRTLFRAAGPSLGQGSGWCWRCWAWGHILRATGLLRSEPSPTSLLHPVGAAAPSVRGLHPSHPQVNSTRQSVTSRRVSVTRTWPCASRTGNTGKSTVATSTFTARAPCPTAASTTHTQRRSPVDMAAQQPPPCPSTSKARN